MITLKLGGIAVGIDNKYDYILRQATDYLTDEPAEFTVAVTDAEREAERESMDVEFSDGYLESIAAYRKIAERLPEYGGFVFHGSVVSVGGVAYAFTAKSGVGKTTHTRLWLSEVDGCHVLNGDKPIIRFIDGRPYAFGTPWRGKEGYGVNEMAPLGGIGFIKRSEKNYAKRLDPGSAVMGLITQIYMPRDGGAVGLTMTLADKLLGAVRLFELGCNMEKDAPRVAYSALVGNEETEK